MTHSAVEDSDSEDESEVNPEDTNDGQKYKSGDDGDDEAEDDDDEDVEMTDKTDTLDTVEEILADFPVRNASRPRCTTPFRQRQKLEQDHVEEEVRHEPDLPIRQPFPTGNI